MLAADVWFDILRTGARGAFSEPVEQGQHLERWIVQLNDSAIAQAGQLDQVDALLQASPPGDVQPFVLRGLGLPGQVLVEALVQSPASAADYFAQLSSVAYASRSLSVSGQAVPNDPEFINQPYLNAPTDADIDAPEAWSITTGSTSVVVGLVDSGIDLSHPDLYLNVWLNPGEIPDAIAQQLVDTNGDQQISLLDLNQSANTSFVTDLNGSGFIDAQDLLADSRWVDGIDSDTNGFVDDLFGWDFVNNDNNPLDDHGHGTHVAGIVGARGNNNLGVTGVAWETSLLPLKFLNESNTGETANAILATNYMTSLRTRVATLANPRAGAVPVRVANNSWGIGGGTGDLSLRDALAAAGDAGILVVAGAGNGDALGRGIDIDNASFFPASFPLDNIISVAATDAFDRLATFSNFGFSTVDIAAPGVGILSTERGGLYGTRNGTSMATPLVSGVAALVFAAHPDASVAEARNALLNGADSLSALNALVTRGARLNALGAVQAEAFAPRSTLLAADDVTTAGGTSQTIVVRYTDSNDIDAASFDDNDLVVARAGFGSTEFAVQLLSVNVPGNGTSREVTYQMTAPGGAWDAIDSGTYEIRLRGGQVRDVTNITSQGRLLGTFDVAIGDATLFIVNTIDDTVDVNPGDGLALDASGKTSLRAAIMEANAAPNANTILLPAGRYGLTQAGADEDLAASGDFDVTSPITVIGDSATTTFVDARTLDRVFDVTLTGDLSLLDVAVQNGRAGAGAGVRNLGELDVTRVVIDNNVASSLGGGIANFGTLAILESWLHDNETTAPTPEGGGGLYNSGSATIDRSTLSANRTAAGFGGTGGGGGIYNTDTGQVTLVNSTLSGNVATQGNGAGIFSLGLVDSTNSTIVDNVARAGFGGGVYNETSSGAPVIFDSRFAEFGDAFDEAEKPKDAVVDARGWTYIVDQLQNRVLIFDEAGIAQPSIGRFGSGPGEFSTADGLAVTTDGTIVVLDRGNGRLVGFNQAGESLFAIGGFINTPAAITAGLNGEFYAFNHTQGQTNFHIDVYDSTGQWTRVINTGIARNGNTIVAMHVQADGSIVGVYRDPFHYGFVLDANGQLLRTFGQTGTGDQILSTVSDVTATSTGKIMVIDASRMIKVFDQQGTFLQKLDYGRQGAGYVGEGTGGNLHVVDFFPFSPLVDVISPTGQFLRSFGRSSSSSGDNNIVRAESDAAGRVAVADTENHRIVVYRPDRSVERIIGSFGTATGKFNQPSSVAFGPQGEIVVVDYGNVRVQVFDAQGGFLRSFDSTGSGTGQFNPDRVTVSPEGEIYVSDLFNRRVHVFDLDGNFLFAFASPTAVVSTFLPGGVAVTAENIFVVAQNDGRIHVFDRQGAFQSTMGSEGSGPGQLLGPTDLTLSPSGEELLVIDPSNDRVTAFSLDGQFAYHFGTFGVGNNQFDVPYSITADASGHIYTTDVESDTIQVFRVLPPGARTLKLKNTVVANNQGLTDADIAGHVQSQGHNLIGTVGLRISGVANGVLGDLVGTAATPLNPQLSALQTEAGLAPVHVPSSQSPAVGAGDNGGAPLIDQLGRSRPQASNGQSVPAVEIGAIELASAEIRGTLFEDRNGNGVFDSDEQGLAGWTVFVDENLNGVLDPGESAATTQSDNPTTGQIVESGLYVLTKPAGAYHVVALRNAGYTTIAPRVLLPGAPLTLSKLYEASSTIAGGASTIRRGPALDGDVVVFGGGIAGGPTATGYFVLKDNELELLTSVGNTPAFSPWLDGGKYAFRIQQAGSTIPGGIYLGDLEGNVQVVAIGTTGIPEGSGTFAATSLAGPGVVNGLAFFHAPGFTTIPDARGMYIGSSESTLLRVVSNTALLPNGNLMGSFDDAVFDGVNYALSNFNLGSFPRRGVYRGAPQGGFVTIFETTQTFPSGQFTRMQGLSLDETRVAFVGRIVEGRIGIYTGTSTADFRTVADTTTSIPDGQGLFTSFDEITSQDEGLLIFKGYGSGGQEGIYAEVGGQLRKIIARGDVLDGQTVGLVEVGTDSVSKNKVAIRVQSMTGKQFIYLASIETAAAQTVTAATGQVLTGVNFAMQPENGSIGGLVFDDADADRVRSQGEATLAGWTVFIDQNANGKLDLDEPQTVTDATGSYKFADLPASRTYNLRVIVQSGFEATLPQFTPGLRTTFLAAGETQASLSFGVRRAAPGSGVSGISGILRGTIYQDNDADGARDAGEMGLAGWTVFLDTNRNGRLDSGERTTLSQSDNPATVAIDEAGNYEFTNLAQGEYVIGVVQQDNVLQTSPRGNVFTDNALLTGVIPSDVLAADFNADGAADVVLARRNTNSVQFLRNSGSGTLIDHLTVAGLSSPVALATGDFNGDQKPDVAIANSTSDKVSVLLHNASPLGFAALANYTAGFYQIDVLATRVDNDALDDLVLLLEAKSAFDSQGQLVILRSTGNGFAAPTRIDVGTRPRSVTAADLDGDGDQDLVVANTDGFQLQILLNNNGVFSAGPVLAPGERPYFVLAADITGDGRPELLSSAFEKNQVAVFTNITSGTTLQFSAAQIYAAGQGPQSLVAVDFDQDGDLDVAVANSSNKNVSLLRNRGGGQLSAPEGLGIASFQQGVGFSLAAADLNQDNLPEILLARADGNQLISGAFAGSLQRFNNQLAIGTHRAAVPTGVEIVANMNFGMQPANQNQSPSVVAGQTFAIAENSAAATALGTVLASDPDTVESLSFSLVSGNDGNAFQINAQGQLSVQTPALLDHEVRTSFSLLVRVTDSTGLFDEQLVTVTVTNVNEAPTMIALANSSVGENALGASIGTVTATDPDSGPQPTLSVDDSRFEIVGGNLKLKTGISLDHESQATVLLAITARDVIAPELSLTQTFTINVMNVAERPTAILLDNSSVAENAPGATVGAIAVIDPEGGAHAFAVSDARFEVSGGLLRLKSGIALDFEAAGSLQLFITATDNTGLSLTESFTITVTNVNDAPTISSVPPQSTTIGVAISGLALTVGDAETSASALVVQGVSSNTQLLAQADIRITGTGAQRSLELIPTAGQSGSAQVTLTVSDGQGGTASTQFTFVVNNPNAAPLEVTSFTPTDTGFVVQFSSPLQTSVLNLFDLPLQFGAADLTFRGDTTGNVPGSLVLDPTFARATFLASAGVLPPDTYTLRLRSGSTSFVNTGNNVLDGDRNGTPGDDYLQTFVVASSSAAVVRVPSLARGPGQAVHLPATSASGIPLELRNAAGAESVLVRLKYDPALLNITSATLGSGAPAGAQLTASINSELGEVTLSIIAPITPFSGGTLELVKLSANVPMTAPYGAKQILDVTQVLVNDGLRAAVAEDGLHVVAFLGDTLGEATSYEPLMAQRIQRVEVGLDQGFAAYPLIDPRIVGNVVPDGVLGGLDAVRIYQESVGIDRPELPPLPSPLPTLPTTPGPDPHVYLPALEGITGGEISVPVLFERVPDDNSDLDLASVQLRIRFPSQLLEVIDILPGDLTEDLLAWTFVTNVNVIDSVTSEMAISASRNQGINPGAGSLALLNLRTRPGASGTARLDLRATDTRLRSNTAATLVLVPAPANGIDANDTSLVIAPNNTAPVANNDSATLDEDTSVLIPVLANDTDAQGLNAAVVTIVTQPLHGMASVVAGGQVRYIPDGNYFGSDSFTYRVADADTFLSNVATVAITVLDVADPWRNPIWNLDVDNDGQLAPVDALLVINYLNAIGSGPLDPPTPGVPVTDFYDVSGDNILSPLDALLVINGLNAGAQMQGEAPIADAFHSAPPFDAHAAALWAWLDEDDNDATLTPDDAPADWE